MTAHYTVVQTDVRTGNVVATLPVTAIQFTHALNAAGTATVGIPLFAPEADPESLSPGVSGLAILRDGEPVWAGILWALAADIDAGTLSLSASGFHSHYQGRYLDKGYTARSTEQASILTDWITYANTKNGIQTSTFDIKPTGNLRTCVWTRYELKNIAQAIEELADNIGGFTFRYRAFWVTKGKRIGHSLAIAKRGAATSSHVLTHRLNCNVTGVSYDSTALCTVAYATGADNGNGEKVVGVFENPSLAARMPERVMVGAYSDVKETRTLIDKAQATINAGAVPVAIPELTLYPGQFSPLDFVPGDVTAISVDAGYVALYDEFVVTECATTVDANGNESIKLALASKELWSNANPS
ncbi:hypothetical protein [Streptomyces violascens]|uniref:Minor tail protein n=1 Tax=Streptomyces violascens TaxID=67381 RepID=A0ABQ3QQR6_9ACTN|nr:hypothetical protein [Streptomyces violascens]GGU49077.1 hypothetical protein GCM10010289_82030 [Streptomyces violascens]GHI39629.1 hypothetical protein Sviol_40370 [Streptomyces violascens]